jgi:hypothetical protein
MVRAIRRLLITAAVAAGIVAVASAPAAALGGSNHSEPLSGGPLNGEH